MEASQPIRRILVGVDADGLAADAVAQGVALARQFDAELTLVHAVEIPPPLWPGIHQTELASMHTDALAAGRKAVALAFGPVLRDAGSEASVGDVLRVRPGHASKVLLETAAALDASLILLGRHAAHSVFDFGSTARAVLSRADLPVWIQAGPVAPVRSILVPVDFSEHSGRALDHAHALATKLQASIRVLHCYSPPVFAYAGVADAIPGPTYVIDRESDAAKEELERWMGEFEWMSVPATSTFVTGDAAKKIVKESEQDDLIVIGTHGRSGLSRFLLGSVAHSVLKRSRTNVVVIPDPSRSWQLDQLDHGPPG